MNNINTKMVTWVVLQYLSMALVIVLTFDIQHEYYL